MDDVAIIALGRFECLMDVDGLPQGLWPRKDGEPMVNSQAALCIDVHTHQGQVGSHVAVFNAQIDSFPDVLDSHAYLSVGIHPWHLPEIAAYEASMTRLCEWSRHDKVIAIGECGLDRLTAGFPREQEAVFMHQIALAQRLGKPLIVHCVRAFAELIRIKKAERVTVPMIVHGFNNHERVAADLLRQGLWMSFGKALLNPESHASRLVANLPLESWFLETDDSGVAIDVIYRVAARLRGMRLEDLQECLYTNFSRVFLKRH